MTMFKTTVKAFAFMVLSILSGCAPPGHFSTDGVLKYDSALVNGGLVKDKKLKTSRSVVLLELLDRDLNILGLCTGAIVDKNIVVTAAHCFDKEIVHGLTGFRVVFAPNENLKNNIVRNGIGFKTHYLYNSVKAGDPNNKIYDHDIAVATFDGGQLPVGFVPAKIETDIGKNHSGKTVEVYGYGRTSDFIGYPNEDLSYSTGQLHRGFLRLNDSYYEYPDRYVVSERNVTFICNGDSGGPQFLNEGGKVKLIGINSAVLSTFAFANGQRSCLFKSQATKVAAFATWIQEAALDLLTQ